MEILFEDNHLIAVNKNTSDLVQVDDTGDLSLEEKVKLYLKEKYKKEGEVFLGVVHRIDRPVSGLVLFARTSKALARINEMFQKQEVKKTYWAIVKKLPIEQSGTLVHFLTRDNTKNKAYAFDKEVKNSKKASLSYKVIFSSDNYNLMEIDLHTGRHHQIRCQLAKIGCPIKGDLKYGFPRSNEDGGICLHSRKMEFMHPVKKEVISITANPPKDKLWDFFTTRI
jgi:23S rRNA pseudouridine1911/1915/1917 synthase